MQLLGSEMRKELFKLPLEVLREEAKALNLKLHGNRVTYIVNRNANFTNVCNVGCAFCGFQRKRGEHDAYTRSIAEVTDRISETPWVTEVCLQGGIHPELSMDYYIDLIQGIRKKFPRIHLHAFSPMEIHSLHRKTGKSYDFILKTFQEAGVGSIPGTAAEILVDEVREKISGNKLNSDTWEKIIRTAHRIGLRSTATIMYGHIETWEQIEAHLYRLKNIQMDTGGFTEFVPLAFIPYDNRLGQKMQKMGWGIEKIEEKANVVGERLYPLARLFFGELIPNLQTSWVKLGLEKAVQSLEWGCNDFGGTLYEESITRSSGGKYGECLLPEEIEKAIRQVKKEPVQRTTTYELNGQKKRVVQEEVVLYE